MALIWSRVFKDVSVLRYLWVFPLAAGLTWFLTLTILLIRWLSIGRPRYPGQVNPDIPFISDIAAFTFKPVFVVGCAITALTFAGTVFAVHHVRYSPKFYGLTRDARWRQTSSFVALIAGLAASFNLFFLSVFDTMDAHARHQYLLMGTFGGLGISAITTTAVWWDQIWGPPRWAGLRRWCVLNTIFVAMELGICVAFVVLMMIDQFRPAGFLEWILTYVGSFWLLSFIGYTKFREGEDPKTPSEEEQRPLLSSE